MLSKIYKLIKALFCKYELSKEEKNFIKLNLKEWKNIEGDEIGTLVEGFIYSPTSVIEKARIAKAIEEKTGCKPLVLLRGFNKKGSNVYEIYKSFNIEHFLFWWKKYLNPFLLLETLKNTINVHRSISSGEELIRLTYKGIEIGDLIYDSIIRTNLGSYTINELNLKDHFRHIFRAYYNCEIYERLFKKYSISNIVTSHKVYIEYGIMCRMGAKHGAKVYLKDMTIFKLYDENTNIKEHHLKIDEQQLKDALENEERMAKAEKYLNGRFNGTINQVDVQNAFSNKKIYTKEELFKINSIKENSNKVVFILPHAFSDSPHCGEKLLYKDYYEWLVETIKTISKVENINIFIKPHPSSYMWNEKGVVESILEKEDINNIYVVPEDFNTNSIKDVADYVLTAQGTAGLEFSCFGIPAIIAGKGYYSGFGIAIEAETKEEYERKLINIKSIDKLSTEIQRIAKMVLYLSFKKLHHSPILPKKQIMPGDNYKREVEIKYKEINQNILEGKSFKDDFYRIILDISEDKK